MERLSERSKFIAVAYALKKLGFEARYLETRKRIKVNGYGEMTLLEAINLIARTIEEKSKLN